MIVRLLESRLTDADLLARVDDSDYILDEERKREEPRQAVLVWTYFYRWGFGAAFSKN